MGEAPAASQGRASASTVWQATDHGLDEDWRNWSGSLRFRPSQVEAPADEGDLAALVRRCASEGRTIRPIGAAHSSTPIIATDDVLVSLEKLSGLRAHDKARARATLGAGTELKKAGDMLLEVGLSMPNFGDVATQRVGGAIGTGTHGSGRTLNNLSMPLVGGRLVTATGDVRGFAWEQDPDFVRALRVSFGTLGILTDAQLQLEPAAELHRQEWCTTLDECLPRLDHLADENRNFDFYWYPRSDEVKLRCLNRPGKSGDYSHFARLTEDRTGYPHQVIPKHGGLAYMFEEMEYAVPAELGVECFRKVRQRIIEKWRRTVGWRLLYRFTKADDSWLSTAHGRETVTISLHQNATLPWEDYFTDIEPIFRDYDGRPHWAKKHSLTAAELRPLYPKWDAFIDLRRRMDPDGVFLTPWLRRLLGVSA